MRNLLLLALVALPAGASADIPPPPGYKEKCTVELQCKNGEEGDTCGAWHGDRDACSKKHNGDGFQLRCRTRGASVWQEVWCRPKARPKLTEAQ